MSLLENNNDESVDKPGIKSMFDLIKFIVGCSIFIAICGGIAYLVLMLVPYTWNEFIDYENGKEIKNHWAIWALYDLGGKKLACIPWVLLGGFMLFSALVFVKLMFTGTFKYFFSKDKK
jgi:hypothetical protein